MNIKKLKNLPNKTKLSLLGSVILIIGLFITLKSAMQEQKSATHAANSSVINHWIIAEYVPYELENNVIGQQYVQSLNTPNTYEIIDRNLNKPDLLPYATHVLGFDSYQDIQTAFATNQIPSNTKVILYDNERWQGTPVIEQQQPFTYVPLAEQLVHQHGLLFMNTPAPDLNTSIEGNKVYDNYNGYLHLQLGTLAKYADIFEIQAQRAGSVSAYLNFSKQAMSQARSANGKIPILLGVTTAVSTSQDIIDEINGTEGISDGYWFNVIGATGPSIALPVIQELQQNSPSTVPSPNISPSPVISLMPINSYYIIVGNKILDQSGNVFTPYGLQIAGPAMAQTTWNTSTSNSQYITQQALEKTHEFWHSNTTRLQISSANLFSGTTYPNYNSTYLNQVDKIVNWANKAGMNIIISLQYEVTTHQWMPTQDSINFWKIIASHYANNGKVFFDIFNEPDPATALCDPNSSTDPFWTFWQYGSASLVSSSCSSPVTQYVGMQDLVNTVRGTGSQNIIIAEGISKGETIDLLPSHSLKGTNIVYAFHPYGALKHLSQWDNYYGNPANKVNAPVVADEWSQDEHNTGGCNINAPTLVPQFLSYLKAHHIGLIAFAYIPGTMVKGNWDITNPTAYNSTATVCPGTIKLPDTDPTLEGSGQLVLQYFIQNSILPILTPSPVQSITPPPKPSSSSISYLLTICPHGLGNCGDNTNPRGGNTSPKHQIRNVSLSFLNASSIPIAKVAGTVSYSPSFQNFQGTINTNSVPSGKYIFIVHMDNYLNKQLPGIISVTQGQIITLPEVSLVTGDVTNDNRLNILDYNALVSCFENQVTAVTCPYPITSQSQGADINDDGVVDIKDLNLFLRELSTQYGSGSNTPPSSVTDITIDGTKNGSIFNGIGAISGGGGNSRLLIDYPEPQRSQILDYLFKPDFGGSLQLLKLEIGGDANSSSGSETSIEHTQGNIDCTSGYEWWIAEQAKLRNPDIQLYGLQWGAPGWVNQTGQQSLWTTNDVSYVIDWLNCAKSHGLTINYIGGWNERGFDANWYEMMRKALDTNGYNNIKIVADDGGDYKSALAQALATDPVFKSAINIYGLHDTCSYPPGSGTTGYKCVMSKTARSLGLPLWESEIGAMDPNNGAVNMVRAINNSYNQAGVTGLLEWNLLDSLPPYLPFEARGLVYANEPWSGYYNVNLMTWAIAHTTQFVKPGWKHVGGANKIIGNSGTYNTYQAPDHSAWTMVAENTGSFPNQQVSPQTIHVSVLGDLPVSKIQVWETDLKSLDPSQWFIQKPSITPINSTFQYTIPSGYVVTFTTTTGQSKGSNNIPPSNSLSVSYIAQPDESNEPEYLSPQDGAYLYEPCKGGASGICIEQMASQQPVFWSLSKHGKMRFPYAVIGDTTWSNYTISSQMQFLTSGSTAGLIGRFNKQSGGGNKQQFNGYEFTLNDNGVWFLYKNSVLNGRAILSTGKVGNIGLGSWHTLSLELSNSQLTGSIDGQTVIQKTDSTYTFGLAGIESNWTNVEYNNLIIK